MPQVIINGQRQDFSDGETILTACHRLGIEIPTLCHDDRLKPCGACRLCVVNVEKWQHPPTACNTQMTHGMVITTASPEIENLRRTLLNLLLKDYPKDAVEHWPDKEFHRWLRHYNITHGAKRADLPATDTASPATQFQDTSHPYLAADFSKCIHCFRCVRICDEVQGQFIWQAFDRGDRTRIAPDAPSLLESDCVSCGACVDTCPTGAIEDKSVIACGLPTRWTRTTCPYCGTGCEMNVGTHEGDLIQVKPVMGSPVSKGHLCVKGRYAFEFVHSADRITRPMIRRNGSWENVSWDDAFAFTANRLKQIYENHGPDSLGVLGSARATNEENYLTQKFARVVLGTNNVDGCARVCHQPTATGMSWTLGTGAATNSFDDIERARTILVCGCNPTENHPIVGARIKQAVLRGAKLIVIDPRCTELTQYAAVHLALRPGTNIPLFNAMAHVIFGENLADETALRERVNNIDGFRDSVVDWTPERAGEICKLNPNDIRQAAQLYATQRPSMCFHGLGVTEHTQGTEGVVALVNLALITGNFGKPGCGINPLRGQNNVQGSAHMGCEPNHLTGYVTIDAGVPFFEESWGTPIPLTKGLNLMQMIVAAAEKKLKGLWAIGYDIAHTNPNRSETRSALRSLDFVIVQDMFVNETARDFGSVFFPACSSFEKDGTFMNGERRVQRVRKVIEPLDQSKSDWEIICGLAKAMGRERQFAFKSAEEVWNEIRNVWKAGAGISYDRLEHVGLQWPCPSIDHPGTTILHTDTFPTGKRAGLRGTVYHPTNETLTEDLPFLLTTGRTLYQFNAGTMTNRTPNAQLHPTDYLDISPTDASRLAINQSEIVEVRSRHGTIEMQARITDIVQTGELFATFHHPDVMLNQLIGPGRDHDEDTPEYKVVAVAVEKLC